MTAVAAPPPSEPSEGSDRAPSASSLRARLETLRAIGARAHDAPAFDLVIALVTKGEALGGIAEARLLARADARTTRLETEYATARARAEAALASTPDPTGHLAEALAKGTLATVFRAARRHAFAPAIPVDPHLATWRARLEANARARGVRPRAQVASGDARDEVHAFATALYEASHAEASATMTALKAAADLPIAAGPYNPLALAAGALAELATLSPSYLAALVAQLADIGALQALPPAPSAESRSPSATRRRRNGR